MKRLAVLVKPGARRAESLVEQPDGSWVAVVTAPPVDGAANEALLRLVAKHFGLRLAQVRIASGAGTRRKRIEIDG